jgi:hypothetical protein
MVLIYHIKNKLKKIIGAREGAISFSIFIAIIGAAMMHDSALMSLKVQDLYGSRNWAHHVYVSWGVRI